jgi:hypothetical protein
VAIRATTARWLSENPLPNIEENYRRNRQAARVNCNLLDHLRQVDGFYSLVPANTHRLTQLLATNDPAANRPLLDFLGAADEADARPMPLITGGQSPVAGNESRIWELLVSGSFDPRQEVLVKAAIPGLDTEQAGPVQINNVKWSDQAVDFEAVSAGGGMAVISQSWNPGWKATVGGRPGRLLQANGAFQALVIPPGRHHVRLQYQERTFFAGCAAALFGMIGCVYLWHRSRPVQ